jgi:hypothetical protein
MDLNDLYLRLGEAAAADLFRQISLGKLRSYQMFDRVKTRLRVTKLNSEALRKSAPRVLERLREGETELGQELAQAILVSHLDMIQDVLNLLGIPHEDGFFAKEIDPQQYLTEGWRQRVYQAMGDKYSRALLVFYVNHLALELDPAAEFEDFAA